MKIVETDDIRNVKMKKVTKIIASLMIFNQVSWYTYHNRWCIYKWPQFVHISIKKMFILSRVGCLVHTISNVAVHH